MKPRRPRAAAAMAIALAMTAALLPTHVLAAAPVVTAVYAPDGSSAGTNFVTVIGSGFLGATSVAFGGNAATGLVVATDSRLTVVAPSATSAGTVDVTVTGPGGTSSTSSADHYAYWAPSTLAAWGSNGSGEIGDNSTTNRLAPVSTATGLSVVTKVVGGLAFTLALKSDGTVWSWGQNTEGELGINSTTDSHVPVQITTLSGIVDIAAGGEHGVALKSDGTVWDWGNNSYGELGLNSKCTPDPCSGSKVPVEVHGVGNSGFLGSIVSIAAGDHHTVALDDTGKVFVWGDNNSYESGNNVQCTPSPCGEETPVQTTGVSNVVQISSSYYFTTVLRNDHTAWCWGDDPWGQCSDGTNGAGTGYAPVPTETLTAAATPLTGIINVAAGGGFSLFVTSAGNVYAGGHNSTGQIGQNSIAQAAYVYATEVKGTGGTGFLSGVTTVEGGINHSIALKSDGTVWDWGLNSSGQLGVNSTTEQNAPVQVLGVGGTGTLGNVNAIGTGQTHTLAITPSTGTLSVTAPAAFSLGTSITAGSTVSAIAMGSLSYTNTLNDGLGWSVTLAATDLYNAGNGKTVPFTGFSVAMGQSISPSGPTPGAATYTALTGTDTTPGTSFSNAITVAGGTSAQNGTYTQTGDAITVVFPANVLNSGSMSATIQYTITG